MFKNGKLVGLTLVSGTLLSTSGLTTHADSKITLPWINWSDKGVDIIPEDVVRAVNDASWNFNAGYALKAESLKEQAESLVTKYNLDIFLPWQDLSPYKALFDLSYCEDLDETYRYLYEKKGVPAEVEKIINCETYYTNVISSLRKSLRTGGTEQEVGYTMRRLVIYFKERELVRKKLAFCVAKYDIELKKRFIDAGQKEDTNGVSKQEKEENTQFNTSEEENEEKQSLVRNDAVSNKSWGFLDIVFGIKDKVKSLLALKEGKKKFGFKEQNLKREAKRKETEFSLSLLVKRFLDAVRGEGKAEVKSENVQNEKTTSNLLETTNLLTDGNVESN